MYNKTTWKDLPSKVTKVSAARMNNIEGGIYQNALDIVDAKKVVTTTADGRMLAVDKVKLDGISSGANKTVVDASLSSSSTNPVQNKVLNQALSKLFAVELLTAAAGTVNANTFGNFHIPISKEGYTAVALAGASSQINCPLVAFSLQTDPNEVYICVRNITTGAISGVTPSAKVLFVKNLS